jgi:hypothetical protein
MATTLTALSRFLRFATRLRQEHTARLAVPADALAVPRWPLAIAAQGKSSGPYATQWRGRSFNIGQLTDVSGCNLQHHF